MVNNDDDSSVAAASWSFVIIIARRWRASRQKVKVLKITHYQDYLTWIISLVVVVVNNIKSSAKKVSKEERREENKSAAASEKKKWNSRATIDIVSVVFGVVEWTDEKVDIGYGRKEELT